MPRLLSRPSLLQQASLKISRHPFQKRSRKGLLGLLSAGITLCGGLAIWLYTSQIRKVSADLPQHFPGPTPVGEIERRSYPAWRAPAIMLLAIMSEQENVPFVLFFATCSGSR